MDNGEIIEGIHHHSCVVWLGGGNRSVFIKEVNEGFLVGGEPLVVLVCWEWGMWIFNVKLPYSFLFWGDVLNLRSNESRIF